MRPVPATTALDSAFGAIDHMPRYNEIPEEFKDRNAQNFWSKLIDTWFFCGLTAKDMATIRPKEGVNAADAFKAVRAILRSFAPKHEHKSAACAYLMSEWFEEV